MNHVFNTIPPYRCVRCGMWRVDCNPKDICEDMNFITNLSDPNIKSVKLDYIPSILFDIVQFYTKVHHSTNPDLQIKILERIVANQTIVKNTSDRLMDLFSYLAGAVVETSRQIDEEEKTNGKRNRMAC